MIEFIFVIFSQIIDVSPKIEAKVKIQTTKEELYIILTKKQPVELTITGPTWIRVYTRIPWSGDKKGTRLYKIILQEDDLNEKFVTLESEYSKVAKIDTTRLSKWRSFYINVPSGKHRYRFIHWRAPSDTIFLKFTSEYPKRWIDVAALSYHARLELVENEKILDYFEVTPEEPVILEIEGPKKLKIVSRLNLLSETQDEQLYTIVTKEKGKIVKSISFRAHPSATVHYRNRPDLLPSNSHTFFINVRKGIHRYEFYIEGGKSGGLRFLVEEK